MKSTYFNLVDPAYYSEAMDGGYDRCWATYKIPILPAYAILNHSIQGVRSNLDGIESPVISKVDGDTITVEGVDGFMMTFQPSEPLLVVNYLGIRDYQCFFPHIVSESLMERAAQFLEEADKTFEESSWLSFVLMAGAVFESYLVDLIGDERSTLGVLIGKVETAGIFDDIGLKALKGAANARNLVHAGRSDMPYMTRDKAMSVRLALENFVRADWQNIKKRYSEFCDMDTEKSFS